eukprot:CAMPEP_0175138034 /NCGR_PEP_ID=MMETSP0087-20121206/10128_1 /TAXON_ID=136419 /ORGANISM="Unknown Unknown, Strain D1" /LENGTH=316 /DNA_ID=CAMNT_0016420899 /DNA_START=35 /DNA_END=984 /DNA_ORIENTATION=-
MAQFSYEGGTPCCWGEHGIYSAAPAILHQPKAVAVQMMRTIPKEHFIPARAGGETYSNFLLEQKGSGPDGMGPGLTYSTTVASRHHVGKQNRGRMVTVRRDAKLVLLSDTGDEWVWSWEVEASSDMSVIITEMKWLIRYKVTGAHDEMQSVLTYGVEYDFPLCYKVIPKLMIFLPCFWPHLAFCLGLYGVCIPCCHAQRTCGGGMEKDMAAFVKNPTLKHPGLYPKWPAATGDDRHPQCSDDATNDDATGTAADDDGDATRPAADDGDDATRPAAADGDDATRPAAGGAAPGLFSYCPATVNTPLKEPVPVTGETK